MGTIVEKVLEGTNLVALNCKLAGTGEPNTTAIKKHIIKSIVQVNKEERNAVWNLDSSEYFKHRNGCGLYSSKGVPI